MRFLGIVIGSFLVILGTAFAIIYALLALEGGAFGLAVLVGFLFALAGLGTLVILVRGT